MNITNNQVNMRLSKLFDHEILELTIALWKDYCFLHLQEGKHKVRSCEDIGVNEDSIAKAPE